MRAMPSPKGTNHARPRRLARDDSAVQEALMQDLGDLKEKLPPVLFADLQAALADYYQAKFHAELDQAEEEIESGEAFVGDGQTRRLRSLVADGMAKYRGRERETALQMFPGLARIRLS